MSAVSTFLPETTRNGQHIWNNERQWPLWDRNEWGESQCTALRELYGLWRNPGGGTQVEMGRPPDLKGQSSEPGETKVIKILRTEWWRRANSRDLQRFGLEYLAEYFSLPVCEEITWSQRKNPSKWIKETILHAPTGLSIVPVTTSQTRKPQDSGGTG